MWPHPATETEPGPGGRHRAGRIETDNLPDRRIRPKTGHVQMRHPVRGGIFQQRRRHSGQEHVR